MAFFFFPPPTVPLPIGKEDLLADMLESCAELGLSAGGTQLHQAASLSSRLPWVWGELPNFSVFLHRGLNHC